MPKTNTNGSTFVLYTTEEGGYFKVVKASEEQYNEAVATRQWDETPWDLDCPRGRDLVDIHFIAFLRVEKNHDVWLGGDRDRPETWHKEHREAIFRERVGG